MLTSGMKITPLRRADIAELSHFLIRGFGVPATSSVFSHEVLSWKYFDGPHQPEASARECASLTLPLGGLDNHPEDSACSLIARSAGRIIGHIGLCRREFIVSGDGSPPVSTSHAIDWLGSPEHPGVGSMLMLKTQATSSTQYAVGANPRAEALFPRLGFEQKPTVAVFRKVLAPFHRLRTADQGLFRRWAGVTKDMVAVWRGRTPPLPRTLELRSVPAFSEEINCVLRRSPKRVVTCQRHHSLLNYLLRCPLSGFSGWTIHTAQRMIGFAVLKITPYGRIQTGKIVDCWLDTEDPSVWQTAVAALIERLRTLAADDVICFATTPGLQAALLWNGFTRTGERKVFVRDKDQCLPRDLPFGLSLLDADGAIL